jgi:hypothetical protein
MHNVVVKYSLPKIKKIAGQKFEEMTLFEEQIQLLYDEKE